MIAVTGWWSLGSCFDLSKSTISVRFTFTGPCVKTQSIRRLPFSVFRKLLKVMTLRFDPVLLVANAQAHDTMDVGFGIWSLGCT